MTAAYSRMPRSESALRNGDCMLRSDFHNLYSLMPPGYRAELIGGVVFEPSPVSWWHGEHHAQLVCLLKTYSMKTPGVSVADNASLFLSDKDEVQPDVVLRIDENAGGNSRLTEDGFIQGAPELVAEIAYTSRSIDLHVKKKRYQKFGISEYIVICVEPKSFYWFDLKNNARLPIENGLTRSVVFPGLQIDGRELLQLDGPRNMNILNAGLDSSEHQAFASGLASKMNP